MQYTKEEKNVREEEIILESIRILFCFRFRFYFCFLFVFFFAVLSLRWTVKNATNNETKTKKALIKNAEVLSFHRNKNSSLLFSCPFGQRLKLKLKLRLRLRLMRCSNFSTS